MFRIHLPFSANSFPCFNRMLEILSLEREKGFWRLQPMISGFGLVVRQHGVVRSMAHKLRTTEKGKHYAVLHPLGAHTPVYGDHLLKALLSPDNAVIGPSLNV